jgi:plasmid stabilization system protein ParE
VSYPVVLSDSARAEFDEAIVWYEASLPGLGERFAERIEEVFERISAAPGLYPRVFEDVRRVTLGRFPYWVLYRLEEHQVFVLAIFHGKRDPKNWMDRV